MLVSCIIWRYNGVTDNQRILCYFCVQGLLMASDDRLVAFMACKMMVAILLSPTLEKVQFVWLIWE